MAPPRILEPAEEPPRRWEYRLVAGLVALGGAVGIGLMVLQRITADEIEHMHTIWAMHQGQRPYLDFFQHHHVLMHWLHAPVIALFGERFETIVWARAGVGIWTALGFWLAHRIARTTFGERAALWTLPLWLSAHLFFVHGIQLRPDNPMLVLELAAVERFVAHQRHGRRLDLAASGFLSFMALAFLQKAVFLLVPLSAMLIWQGLKKRVSVADLAAFAGAFLLPVLVFLGILAATGHLKTYWLSCWLYNLLAVSPVPISKGLGKVLPSDLILIALAALGIWKVLMRPVHGRAQKTPVVVFLFFLGLPLAFTHGMAQYYLPALPFLCMLAAYGASGLGRGRVPALMASLLLSASLFILDLPKNNRTPRALITFALENSGPGDCLADGENRFNVFRNHCDHLWFLIEDESARAIYETIHRRPFHNGELLRKAEPQIIGGWRVEGDEDWLVEKYRKVPITIGNTPHELFLKK
jgi:hypothetical protein